MSRSTIFFTAIGIAVISVILVIYYAIPGVYHVLTSGSHPAMDPQPTHIVLFLAIAVICVIAALVTRPKRA